MLLSPRMQSYGLLQHGRHALIAHARGCSWIERRRRGVRGNPLWESPMKGLTLVRRAWVVRSYQGSEYFAWSYHVKDVIHGGKCLDCPLWGMDHGCLFGPNGQSAWRGLGPIRGGSRGGYTATPCLGSHPGVGADGAARIPCMEYTMDGIRSSAAWRRL
jgi:hypothetical protein